MNLHIQTFSAHAALSYTVQYKNNAKISLIGYVSVYVFCKIFCVIIHIINY